MRSAKFWIKALLLTAITIACIGHMLFLGMMEFLTRQQGADITFAYWCPLAIHITIILICILYWVNRVLYWYKNGTA
ncbi:hypothetical protein HQ865_00410 [Mucilaginibacter mali]|uniref:Uncharacterized protein n=1 Tax=Mucilaginibacter mali TaxID=2740462 RepID=A0A7D4UKF8_9SPHI|nr:hypothetical protein [Mucilaginibacter mali]QKJ28281.1 hypothetical protein HQ865_00410 [Mucilaginibacter mali]